MRAAGLPSNPALPQLIRAVVGRGRLAGLALPVLLSACTPTQSDSKNLPLACEVSKCDCVEDGIFGKNARPPSWKPDGTAFCPVNFHLRALEIAPSLKWGS
jgi:hypothetical protein